VTAKTMTPFIKNININADGF